MSRISANKFRKINIIVQIEKNIVIVNGLTKNTSLLKFMYH